MVLYIIYLKDGQKFRCDVDHVWPTFMSLHKGAICSIHKLYQYDKEMNICLYAYEFPDVDCLENYITLSSFYGPHAIQDTDVQLVTYLRQLPRNESGRVL